MKEKTVQTKTFSKNRGKKGPMMETIERTGHFCITWETNRNRRKNNLKQNQRQSFKIQGIFYKTTNVMQRAYSKNHYLCIFSFFPIF